MPFLFAIASGFFGAECRGQPIGSTAILFWVDLPVLLPCLAIGRGQLQLDRARALRRRLWLFVWQAVRAIPAFRRAVRTALSAQCAESAELDRLGRFASGSDCLGVPLIYGYLLPA